MRTMLRDLLFTLSLTGCLSSPTTEDIATEATPDEVRAAVAELAALEQDDGACPIVADEGPCAVACDHDALLEYVQKGTCTIFRCELADGTTAFAGTCNP